MAVAYTTINAEITLKIASKWLKIAYPTATLPVPPTSNQRAASIRMANRSVASLRLHPLDK